MGVTIIAITVFITMISIVLKINAITSTFKMIDFLCDHRKYEMNTDEKSDYTVNLLFGIKSKLLTSIGLDIIVAILVFNL